MRLLVVCQDYPNARAKDITAFVHTRNLGYRARGHHVDVLSFAARASYEWDGFNVLVEREVRVADYDACVFHAPNLRNALRFMLKHRRQFRKLCLVGHGHEFLNWFTYLPAPYPYDLTWRRRLRRLIQPWYDRFKLRAWVRFFKKFPAPTMGVILVSNSMRADVERDMRVDLGALPIRLTVINNPIHQAFVTTRYQTPAEPKADFVTLRSFDNPKYAVDLVVELARRLPERTFHLYGAGRMFDFTSKPPNLTVIHAKFKQPDLPGLFAQYRCALLPTRQDTQGVMMCEIACLGMPLWTSDLSVCREFVGAFSNVRFLNNDDLPRALEIPPVNPNPNAAAFAMDVTIDRELAFLASLPEVGVLPRLL